MLTNVEKRFTRLRVPFMILVSIAAQRAPGQIISTVAGSTWAFPSGPLSAAQAPVGLATAVAVDASGNSYIADVQNDLVLKVNTSGTLTVAAGGAPCCALGDGGPATSAWLNSPNGLAVDSAGNLYIADSNNNRVRMVNPSGIIITVAGNGSLGYSGDGGLATSTSLFSPEGVAVDSSGNLFIADSANQRIRKVTAGIISTIAGNGAYGFGGDGGLATAASLNYPRGVSLDTVGDVFIADTSNNRVRMVSTTGVISTVAGSGQCCTLGDGGPATNAALSSPGGVAVDSAGDLFIADTGDQRIRKVTAGVITTVAGNGSQGFSGDGGPATSAALNTPKGIGLDSAAELFIADTNNDRIRFVPASQIISTIAGDGDYRFSGDGGPAISASLNSPRGVAADTTGDFFIGDSINNRIREVGANGIITTIAGNGVPSFSGDGGPATSASLDFPNGIALDNAADLFIADTNNNRIREVSPNGTITTVAGSGQCCSLGDGGPAIDAWLAFPYGVAVDSAGDLFIADSYNSRVRKVTPDGNINTVAGNGTYGFLGDNGPATSASLSYPTAVAVDSSGNIYIADTFNQRIRMVNTSGTIFTVAGNGIAGSAGDGGLASNASLDSPYGVIVDSSGNLFIADTDNEKVRLVNPSGIISTVAGNGIYGFSGDNGLATSAYLANPYGVAVDNLGNLYIADTSNYRIREVKGVAATTPRITTASPLPLGEVGVPYSLTFAASGGTPGYSNWALAGGSLPGGLGLNSATGALSGPPTGVGTSAFSVTVQDSKGATSAPASFSLTINAALCIASQSPLPTGTVGVFYTYTFTACNGVAPYSNWIVTSGILPSGLTLNSSTGVLSGTPAIAATGTFSVGISDSLGASISKTFSLTFTPGGSSQGRWISVHPLGTLPSARADASAVYIPGISLMIVFGGNTTGCTSAASLNDTWQLSGANGLNGASTWTQLAPLGTTPPVRRGHTAIYNTSTDRMIVFGGDAFGCSSHKYNDVWVMMNASGAGGSPAWTQLAPTGTIPPARSDHVAIYDQTNNRMVIFGGDGASANLNDVWVLSHADGTGGTAKWTKLAPTGTPPTATGFMAGTYDSTSNRMTLFGGWVDSKGPTSNQTWLLTNANGTGGAAKWSQLTPGGTLPSPRAGARGLYKPSTNTSFYFAGSGKNDVWALTNANGSAGTTWTQLATSGTSPAGRGGVASNPTGVEDVAAGRGIYFGGKGPSGMFNDTWILAPISQ